MNRMIRQELPKDYKTTEEVVKQAFLNEQYSDGKEHQLVNRIRKSKAFIPELSLVAIGEDKAMIGHILLSKISIVYNDQSVESLALAPVSVAPQYQKKGIGSQLIHEGLKKAKALGYHSVIVLGHKDYYPKFGFKQALLWNIKAPFEVPDEAFMALELTEDSLETVQGVVHYPKAFSE
ncbi:N-acetyltransferase [Oceanobacillus profundus]|uniref:GNAT family N-acetyltransferase n=1 Tax=Oceanobacillus profundus TaxID=372463 RepID=UPI000BA56E90|nr:N-acetyltransferase [Oceanobacillus profundus]MCM3398224.1 N-acetyltransferase [Oceanobacillus profundus]PAE29279.1 GNAT family N-acetyltransferase [Paenibacillus sp. 7884-2]